MKKLVLCCIIVFGTCIASAQQKIEQVVANAKQKLNSVQDYIATGRMKTNVAFLKVPVANVTVYFKQPNRIKVKSEKGISFIPKGAVSINMGSVLTNEEFTILDAGTETINGVSVRVAKLLPMNDNSEVVLSTLYIEEATSLVRKAKTTTRENGSFELEMNYGKFANFGLPDKIVFSFNTKDYKLPKGVTFDFDDGAQPKAAPDKSKNKKGRAEITFSNYVVNKGVDDAIFK